jgi:hypothetical protein
MVFISNRFTSSSNISSTVVNPDPDPVPTNPDQKSYNFINITNYETHDNQTKAIIDQAIQKWESVIISTPNNIFLNFSINISLLSEGVLGGASMSKYYVIQSQTVEDYEDPNNPGFINPNLYTNYFLGQVIGKEGNITLNSTYWEPYKTSLRDDGLSNAYYVLLHELGHLIGIGPLWWLKNTRGYDTDTNTYFYMGSRAIQKYNESLVYTNPNGATVDLLFIPIEDNGGSGTALVHPEEGQESGVSTNTRKLDGVLYPGLDEEIMTGWIENDTQPLPLSIISVGFCHDLGYTVNYTNADFYALPYDNEDPKGEIPQ